MKHPEYSSTEYQKARRELLEGNPVCYWCKRAPATEADHLIEVDSGGSHADGMVPSCKPCNSKRGTEHLNRKRARQTQTRNAALNNSTNENGQSFFVNANQLYQRVSTHRLIYKSFKN